MRAQHYDGLPALTAPTFLPAQRQSVQRPTQIHTRYSSTPRSTQAEIRWQPSGHVSGTTDAKAGLRGHAHDGVLALQDAVMGSFSPYELSAEEQAYILGTKGLKECK